MPDNPGRERIVLGPLILERNPQQVRHREHQVRLTGREFIILWTLASVPGKVFERQELLRTAWGKNEFVEPRTIDAHVVKIRRKLRCCGVTGIEIETIWKAGYRVHVTP